MRDDVLPHLSYSYLFNLHSRLLKKIEPILAKKIGIKKDHSLTPDKILKLIADVTEQPIQRPKHGQKKSYYGKKKQHTYYGRRREDIIGIKILQGQGT